MNYDKDARLERFQKLAKRQEPYGYQKSYRPYPARRPKQTKHREVMETIGAIVFFSVLLYAAVMIAYVYS